MIRVASLGDRCGGLLGAEMDDVGRCLTQRVMAGLVPAIPTITGIAKEAVTSCDGAGGDGRDKPGHDGWNDPRLRWIFLFGTGIRA